MRVLIIETDCGNGNVDEGEQCDGNNLNGQTCQSQGFGGGILGCKSNCMFDTSGCYNDEEQECRNGVQEGSEQCDGSDLNGQTCQTRGYDSGILKCDANCNFDESGCTGEGYGKVDLYFMPVSQENPIVRVPFAIDVVLKKVSGGQNPVSISAQQNIFTWDSEKVYINPQLDRSREDYDWSSAGFPDDSGLDGLNNDMNDGDSYAHFWAQTGRGSSLHHK